MARSRWIVGLVAVVALSACGGGGGTNDNPPPPTTRTLTVTIEGLGSGTVTSSPAGISCSSGTCAATFDQETSITLTASPGAGSAFAGWSGGLCGGSGPCSFPLGSDVTVTATFDLVPPVTHMLEVVVGGTGNGSVASAPAGIDCDAPNTCSNLFTEGADVILTAAALDDGSTFAGWGGACSAYGAAPSCTVNMTGDLTVTATFDPPPPKYRLSVTVAGAGSGSVASSPAGINCSSGTCAYDYFENTDVTLTATPAGSGYVFTGWSQDCSGTGTCTVTMSAARNVTATFETVQTVSVNMLGDGVGNVTSVPAGIDCTTGSSAGCSAVFSSGTNVSLTATAAAGSGFFGWSPTCDGSLGPCEFPVISSTTLNATFTAWAVRRPFPTDVRGVTALGSTLAAVGSGAFVTGTDGLAWTGHELAPTAKLRAAAADAGGNVAVAVGEAGLVMSSADAASWTPRTSNTAETLNAVVHGGGSYVAVGGAGALVSSANGGDWTARVSGTPYELLAVAYGSSTFVAVGYGGTILASSNGADWSAPASPVTEPLVGVAYDPSAGFVAVGRAGAVVTSPDGSSWTKQAASLPVALGVEVRGVAASASGTFVAIDSSHAIHRSTTGGTSWTTYAEAEDLQGSSVTGIGAAGGAFFALSDYGMSRSPDGLAWTRVLTLGPTPQAMAYGNSTYVLVAHGAILTSPDGATWTSRWAGNPYLRASDMVSSVVYANSQFIAVSGHGILSSTDGAAWAQVGPAPSPYGGQVAWGSGKGYVVTSADSGASSVLTSPDGSAASWSVKAGTGITFPLYGITYGNSTFVAVGGSGSGSAIYTNADPANTAAWIQQSSPTTHVLGGVLWGNATFVANDSQSGQDSYTSANAINWTGPHGSPSWMGKLIGFGGGLFVTQTFMQSADGQIWALMPWRPSAMTYIYAGTGDGPDGWVVTDGRAFAVHP